MKVRYTTQVNNIRVCVCVYSASSQHPLHHRQSNLPERRKIGPVIESVRLISFVCNHTESGREREKDFYPSGLGVMASIVSFIDYK